MQQSVSKVACEKLAYGTKCRNRHVYHLFVRPLPVILAHSNKKIFSLPSGDFQLFATDNYKIIPYFGDMFKVDYRVARATEKMMVLKFFFAVLQRVQLGVVALGRVINKVVTAHFDKVQVV